MVREASFIVCLALAGHASAQVVRISVGNDGSEANGPSAAVSISGTGRYVVFESSANNIVDSDTNSAPDIFLRDRDTWGRTVLPAVVRAPTR